MSRGWRPPGYVAPDRERIAELEHRLRLLADHIGVDVEVLDIVNSSLFRDGVYDWPATEVAQELDLLDELVDRGEPLPIPETPRAKTIQRWWRQQRASCAVRT